MDFHYTGITFITSGCNVTFVTINPCLYKISQCLLSGFYEYTLINLGQ